MLNCRRGPAEQDLEHGDGQVGEQAIQERRGRPGGQVKEGPVASLSRMAGLARR